MHVRIWRCEHAVLCGNSHVSNLNQSFMPVCISMMPVILYNPCKIRFSSLFLNRNFDSRLGITHDSIYRT